VADVRGARCNAEKVAREALAGTLVGVAGELGVARARQQEAAEGVEAAAEKGRQLAVAAKAEAAALLDRAKAEVTETDGDYGAAWQAARDAGWTRAQLRGMGYPAPGRRRTIRAERNQPESSPVPVAS
jgi:hypothetical protein